MAKHAHTASDTSPEAEQDAPDRPDTATAADYAALEFDPIPNALADLPPRDEWLKRAADQYPIMVLALVCMQKTPDELAEIVRKEPDASADLMESFLSWEEAFEGYAKLMNAAFIRSMAGACRAELA